MSPSLLFYYIIIPNKNKRIVVMYTKKRAFQSLEMLFGVVPEVGLEPTRCYPLDFESSASAIPPLRHISVSFP